ncbi:MAG: hemin receptor, partial [Bacteroidaceae bacterium]|nr:hemin receptor [Bacteroidaceae bacterium]
MKKRYSLMAVLLMATAIAKAQDTYMNDRLTATDDIDGTARFVGMGGAMGALGADLSVISSNPAG